MVGWIHVVRAGCIAGLGCSSSLVTLVVEIDVTPEFPPPNSAHRADPTTGPGDAGEPTAHEPVVGPPRFFISYRRSDTAEFVETLDRRVREDMGSQSVFRDAADLIAGEPFERRLFEEINASDIVLVVIGPAWAAPLKGGTNGSRLDDPDDFVRREVRAALENRPRSMPMPVLVAGAAFPPALPSDIEAVAQHHGVVLDHDELGREDSRGYQAILVGAWVAKSRSVPNGVLVFGDGSPTATARLDALVSELKQRDLVDVSRISRYACGAQMLSLRKARRLARRFPDVIVVVDEGSARSPVLTARVDALLQHRVGRVAVLTFGGTITFSSGVAVSSGALEGLAPDLGAALARLGAKSATSTSRMLSLGSTTPLATKVAAGFAAVGALTGGALGVARLFDSERSSTLDGDWDVGTFVADADNIENVTSFESGTMSFRKVDEDCGGDDCEIRVVDGPDVLRGATLVRNDETSFSIMLPADADTTIRSLTDGGLRCPAEGEEFTDITDRASLSFGVHATDDTAASDLVFTFAVHAPAVQVATGSCSAGTVEWTATASRLD
jgi:hypothetical protein